MGSLTNLSANNHPCLTQKLFEKFDLFVV